MPVTKSAARAMRVSAKKHEQNRATESALKTKMTQAEKLVASGDIKAAKKAVNEAVSSLDRAADKGVIHAKNASRRKSRLTKKLNQKAAAKNETSKPEGAK